MKNKRMRILVYILGILPLIVFLALYQKLPEQMPAHWNIDGTVRYDSKNSFFMYVGMSILFAFMFDVLPKIDPRKKNYLKFSKYYDGFCVFMMVFLNGMLAIVLVETFHPGTVAVEKYVMVMISLVFLISGNMLPTVKSNFYVGFRTPWSLSDNEVWNKCNRLGGHLMFWSGVILLLGTLLLPPKVLVFLLLFLVGLISLVPTVMSYLWYKKRHGTQ